MRLPYTYALLRALVLSVAAATQAGAPPTRAQAFALGAVSNRIITPNGDGRNDVAVFTFSNPQFSDVTGSVYDMRGRLVAAMRPGPIANASLQWDGKTSGGAIAPTGVYIYALFAEGKIYRGAVVVVR